MINLEDLKAKAKAATPGEWECNEVRTQCGRAFRIGSGEMLKAGKGCCIIYDDYHGGPENERKANAAFIVAACNSVLPLIEEIMALRKALATAAMPLEAMRLGGTDTLHHQDLQAAITGGIDAARERLGGKSHD